MHLTVYTDYALRVLTYLALREGELATIAEIADSYQISKTHLMKVTHQLGVAGYVETVRGRGGGLRLAKPVEAIGVGEVGASHRAGHGDRFLLQAGRCALRHPALLCAAAFARKSPGSIHGGSGRLHACRPGAAARPAGGIAKNFRKCGLIGKPRPRHIFCL